MNYELHTCDGAAFLVDWTEEADFETRLTRMARLAEFLPGRKLSKDDFLPGDRCDYAVAAAHVAYWKVAG